MNDPAVIGMYTNGFCPPAQQPTKLSQRPQPSTGLGSYEAASLSSLLGFNPGSNAGGAPSGANAGGFCIGGLQDQQIPQSSQIPVHNLLGLNFAPNTTMPPDDDLIDRAASAPLVTKKSS